MKNYAILACLVATLCIFQIPDAKAESLNVLKAKLDRDKNKVETGIRSLTRERNYLESNLDIKLHNDKINSMQAINNLVNPVIRDIRTAVDAAKAEGKNAEQCYENARLSLAAISKNGYASLDKCGSDAKSSLSQAKSLYDSTISTGQLLLGELNSIFPSCYSSNIIQMQSCISIKLGSASGPVRNFESTVNSVTNSGNSAINQGKLQGVSCFNGVISKLSPEIPPVKPAALNCVKNA